MERENAIEYGFEQESDKIEEKQEKETLDWIEEEERKDREAAIAKDEAKAKDDAWMVEQLKKEHGDDFGEDVDLDFSE